MAVELKVVAYLSSNDMADPDLIPNHDQGTCLYLPALHSEDEDQESWEELIGVRGLSQYERHFFVFNRPRTDDNEGYEAIRRYFTQN